MPSVTSLRSLNIAGVGNLLGDNLSLSGPKVHYTQQGLQWSQLDKSKLLYSTRASTKMGPSARGPRKFSSRDGLWPEARRLPNLGLSYPNA